MDYETVWRLGNTAGVLGLVLFIVVLGFKGNVWVWKREKDAETTRADKAEALATEYKGYWLKGLEQNERMADALVVMAEIERKKRRG